jgi:threonine dehydratase
MMAKLPRDQLKKGVICSSAGNHAQGVALAARKLGCDAIIAMPVTTPEIKVSAMPSDFFLLLSCKGFKLVKSYS